MDELNWYDVTVKVRTETENGVKWTPEPYLVHAVNATDVEKKVALKFQSEDMNLEYKVTRVSEKKLLGIIE